MDAGSKVPAADQTLAILAHLAAQRGPVPAATIAQSLSIPRSTVYHLLAVMQERGFVVHLPEAKVLLTGDLLTSISWMLRR